MISSLLHSKDNVKLSNFGIFYITYGGQEVEFPIGYGRADYWYSIETGGTILEGEMMQEHLEAAFEKFICSLPIQSDVWSLGILLMELHTGRCFLSDAPLLSILSTIAGARTSPDTGPRTNIPAIDQWLDDPSLDPDLRLFATACLCPDPRRRADLETLLSHEFFLNVAPAPVKPSRQTTIVDEVEIDEDDDGVVTVRFSQSGIVRRVKGHDPAGKLSAIPPSFPSPSPATTSEELHPSERLTSGELFYLWKLSGGDVEVELAKQGFDTDSVDLYSDRIYTLNLSRVRAVLAEAAASTPPASLALVAIETQHPVNDALFWHDDLLCSDDPGDLGSSSASQQHLRVSLATRERDMRYQYSRMQVFARMLLEWPTEKGQLHREAKIDIPPVSLCSKMFGTWECVAVPDPSGQPESPMQIYRGKVWAALLDIEGDTQLDYDVIDKETETETDRQYNELLSSAEGHIRLRRVLKAWLAAEKDRMVYWQGLDSLAAVFLSLNFNEEALAFTCFQRFVGKFLGNFFVHDNSPVFQEYMCSFQHLLSFHEPTLSAYVYSIGLHPDLYAIPWVMTLFAHVFNLEKVYHLYDKFLVGPPSLPLFFGVAILAQTKDTIMVREFNEWDPNSVSDPNRGEADVSPLNQLSRPVTTRKQELVGRVVFRDTLKMLPYCVVLDVRPQDE
ncbi:hypothetical protein HDU93_007353 [Gonapodya sp. JEL0774]|nr:hypothetical protein HDU93_007353 [Gonapodya sp. JEL0774]